METIKRLINNTDVDIDKLLELEMFTASGKVQSLILEYLAYKCYLVSY